MRLIVAVILSIKPFQINFKDELGQWAIKFSVPLSAVDCLLKVLDVYHPLLPLDARTVLKTAKILSCLRFVRWWTVFSLWH
jgi:hypothetical protein